MNRQDYQILESIINRPRMYGINDNSYFEVFFRGVEIICKNEENPILYCYNNFVQFCKFKILNSKIETLSGIELLTIYCYYYQLDEYQFRKFLMAKFLREEYNHEVSYDYEIFEIQDIKKPFEDFES